MHGRVKFFDPVKKFGYITTDELNEDVFVHLSDVRGQASLTIGQELTFDVINNHRGPAARNVKLSHSASPLNSEFRGRSQSIPNFSLTPRSAFRFYGGVAGFLIVTVVAIITPTLQIPPLVAYLLSINAVTFLFFGYDKAIAGRGIVRVPEKILHALALAGGSPGALIAMKAFRHKTIKGSFQIWYWVIVAGQLIALSMLGFDWNFFQPVLDRAR